MQIGAVAAVAAHGVLAGIRGAVGGHVLGQDAMVPIVGGAFGVVAEDTVGGGDAGEAFGGGGIVAVAIGVVAEREGVELSGVGTVTD